MSAQDISILIPARNEMFLARTIEDILANIEADTEVIVVLDGQWALVPFFAALETFPVKCPKVAHDGNHRYIVSSLFKSFQHLPVKTFIKAAVSVSLDYIFRF